MYQRNSDGKWCDTVYVNGKRKVIYGKTQKELLAKLKAYKGEAEKGPSFAATADAWEKHHTEKVTYKTAEVYRPCVKRAKDYFEGVYIKDITPFDVDAFINYIADKGYAQRTVQAHLDMMRMIFKYAIIQSDSVIRVNPCASVSLPSGLVKTRREPPTDDEIGKLTTDSQMGLFATFLLYTGLRRGELLALQWKDIDFEKKVIRISKSVTYTSNQPSIKTTKTEKGIREVDLLDALAAALPEAGKPDEYIFGKEKPLTKSSFRKRWLSYCKSVGIEVTPHQFRHAYASMLDDAGIDETVAMNLLGHSSIQVTKDVYTHLRERKKKRAASQLNQYISATQIPQSIDNTT